MRETTERIVLFCASVVLWFGISLYAESPQRIVYPQAVVGPFQGQTYEIELRFVNKNAFREWSGTLRMLRPQDLQEMMGIDPLIDGKLDLRLGPGRSSFLKLTSAVPQAGVLVIESGVSSVADVLPAFWYRVIDSSIGRTVDLVSVAPASVPTTAVSIVGTRADGVDVGVAILPERALAQSGMLVPAVPLSVTAVLEDGAQITGVTPLSGQRAFFAGEVLPAMPANARVSRLMLSSRERFYAFSAAIGSGPQFVSPQITPLSTFIDDSETLPLRVIASTRGVHLGAAVQARLLAEPDYSRTLAREFDMVTPENEMKFGPVHPGPTTYSFTAPDSIVDFALQHGMEVKGHTLVWHSQLPAWLTNRSWTRDELMGVLRDHIMTMVGHYKDRVSYWDVVNEAIDDSGNLRNTIWLQVIGPDYIDMAFRWAHEADPSAKLLYNDYAAEGLGRKSDAVYTLVRNLIQNGVPIRGVGLQGHLDLSAPPRVEDITANLARLAALGLDVYFSELDIRIQGPTTETKLFDQATLYGAIAGACAASPNCKAIGLWGFTDKYSWIPSFYPGYGDALIFDNQYLPKPAYQTLLDTLAK